MDRRQYDLTAFNPREVVIYLYANDIAVPVDSARCALSALSRCTSFQGPQVVVLPGVHAQIIVEPTLVAQHMARLCKI